MVPVAVVAVSPTFIPSHPRGFARNPLGGVNPSREVARLLGRVPTSPSYCLGSTLRAAIGAMGGLAFQDRFKLVLIPDEIRLEGAQRRTFMAGDG